MDTNNNAFIADFFIIVASISYVMAQVLYIKRTKDFLAILWKGGPFTFLKFNFVERCFAICSLVLFIIAIVMYLDLSSKGIDPKGILFD